MNNREAAEMMGCPPTKDDQIGHNNNTTDEVEIQIAKGTPTMSVSDSQSSSSYARSDDQVAINLPIPANKNLVTGKKLVAELRTIACTCYGHHNPLHHHQADILNDLPEMPAGVKFDPSDIEILEHLEAKVQSDFRKLHPLIDEFIRTLEGDNGICYTHPENLPGVSKDGLIRHFFHRPSKAYTTGTRKRRKVHTHEDDGSGSTGETRWHKTGKTRAVLANGKVKGFKKILVLYTNYGRQRKPEKTNWVMHQYHLGHSENEKDGELVLSKVFYQTQTRHSVHLQPTPNEPVLEYPQHQLLVGSSSTHVVRNVNDMNLEYYHSQQPQFISFGERDQGRKMSIVPHSISMQFGDHDDRDKSREQFEADRRANNN